MIKLINKNLGEKIYNNIFSFLFLPTLFCKNYLEKLSCKIKRRKLFNLLSFFFLIFQLSWFTLVSPVIIFGIIFFLF